MSADKKFVIVHVTFVRIGEINTVKEAFDADVLIRSRWRESELDKSRVPDLDVSKIDWSDYWNPKLFIENAIGETKSSVSQTVEYTAVGEAIVMERKRLKGSFMEQMELYEFPFDVQDLTINIMSEMQSADVEMIEDPEEIHKIFKQSFIDEQEFHLYKYIEAMHKELQKDRGDPFSWRSVLAVRCRAARRYWYFVGNHFIVTFLIAILSFLTFAVEPKLVQNRLQLAFILILTNVTFKFGISQNLPRISYLTYLDWYVLATMGCLACVCFWHGIQTLIGPQNNVKANSAALITLGSVYCVYNFFFLIKLLTKPLKRRREMHHAEQIYTRLVKEQAIMNHTSKGNILHQDVKTVP